MPYSTQIDDLINLISSNSDLVDDEAISTLITLAQAQGLASRDLRRILDLLISSNLSTKDSIRLTQALVPLATIDSSIALQIVCHLGEAAHSRPIESGRVKYPLQRRLLQQLVIFGCYQAISQEGLEALRRSYGLLEKGLDYEMLREPTALLLSHIVEVQQASGRRLAKLEQLSRLLPESSPAFLLLASKYRAFLGIHDSEPPVSLSSATSQLDDDLEFSKWRSCIEMQFAVASERAETPRANKRRKLSHTQLETSELESLARKSAQPVRSSGPSVLANASDAELLDRQSRLRSWSNLLECGYGRTSERFLQDLPLEVTHHISSIRMERGVEGLSVDEDSKASMFNSFLCLCEISGELPQEFESVLAEHLEDWDGNSSREETFRLISYLKPPQLEVFNEQYLKPLSAVAKEAEVEWICDCIASLSDLMTNWAVRDDFSVEVGSFTASGQTVDVVATLACLQRLLEFLDDLIETSTIRFQDSLELRLAALLFYEKSLDLSLVHELPVVVVPSQVFAYPALFSYELSCISRMAGIIARLREALTGDCTAIPVEDALYTAPITALNNLLVDFGNPLWKRQFLSGSSPEFGNAGMGLSEAQLEQLRIFAAKRDQSSGSALGLTTHGALASLAVSFLQALACREGKQVDDLPGAVSTATLKQLNKNHSPTSFKITFTNFRPIFLEHLRDRGATGLYEFLFSSMQSLIKRRESQGEV